MSLESRGYTRRPNLISVLVAAQRYQARSRAREPDRVQAVTSRHPALGLQPPTCL